MRKWAMALVALGLSTVNAFAADCNSLFVDEAKVTSDPARVERAAKDLANMGVTIRVRTIPSSGGKNLDKYALDTMAKECPNWVNARGNDWAGTLMLFLYAPNDRGQIYILYGVSNTPRIGGDKWREVIKDKFLPASQAYLKSGKTDKEIMTTGFSLALQDFSLLFGRSSTGTGNVTINQSGDYSILWYVLGLLVLGVLGVAGFALYRKTREDLEDDAETQQVSSNARSRAVAGINEITSSSKLQLLEAMVQASGDQRNNLTLKLSQYRQLGDDGLAALQTIDVPKDSNGAAASYAANKSEYERIVRDYVLPAQRIAQEINA